MSSGFLGGGIGPTAIKRRSGLAAPVPVAGAELLTNGDFASATGWNIGDWSIGGGVATKTAGSISSLFQSVATPGKWHRIVYDAITITAGSVRSRVGDSYAPYISSPASQIFTQRSNSYTLGISCSATFAGTVDNATGVLLTLSSLFSSRPYASANCDLSAAVARTDGTQAGFVARLDSATSPANFIIAYLDGAGNVKVDKCVAGTYTNVISGAVTYAAGRVLRLVCSGNSVSAYYNGTQVGSTVTVSDAGIVSNTRHGLFSTYSGNTFAGYVAA